MRFPAILLGLLSVISACCSDNSLRIEEDFCKDWSFHLGDVPGAAEPGYDDASWRVLDLPHDWAVEGDFSPEHPSGTGGGALPGGIGWYRKTFTLPASDSARVVKIVFDGVYMNSEVYLNGHLLGTRPFGYVSFAYELSPYLRWDGENVLAVKVDNSLQPNSRWYSGCGIYRKVTLVKTETLRVADWGTYVVAEAGPDRPDAQVGIVTKVTTENEEEVRLRSIICDDRGRALVKKDTVFVLNGESEVSQNLILERPRLWSVDEPYLYTLVTELYRGSRKVDQYRTRFGVRYFDFDAEKGFSLNGKPLKINGVCLHHDLGCLGAAFNPNAMRRQLAILKEMGCNGIRTSHNPPAPEVLDLCDEMGFIVMGETFDMWRRKKTAYDYSLYFDKWYERDLSDIIVRDRNHPSVFMWCIGNEVLEQWSSAEAENMSVEQANLLLNFARSADQLADGEELSINSLLTIRLAEIVRGLDPTRPITAGCNEPDPKNHLFKSGALDIIGYNYHNQNVASVPENFPGQPFIITESNSALATRGYYRMPSDSSFVWPVRWDIPFFDESFSCSSYDNCHVPWGNTHEESLKLVRDNDFVSGQYIWTGFDYIGEPTPYGWPARSSYFGIVDLAGFPKDAYWLYKSEWTDSPVLHLFPHWNWEDGKTVDMWCYYNCADEVELFVNGRSEGVRAKTADCLHAAWRVVYEAGTVEVVSRKDGVETGRKAIRTAGEPAALRLKLDQYGQKASERALGFVSVEVVDAEGNLCPWADDSVSFEIVSGSAHIAGVDNGDPTSLESFKAGSRRAFYGKCLVVLEAEEAGKSVLRAVASGLEGAEVVFSVR